MFPLVNNCCMGSTALPFHKRIRREEVGEKEKQREKSSLQEGDSRIDCVSALSDLMLQTAVLSLCVLPDDHDVNVLVASLDSREGLAVHHIGIEV